MIKVFEEELKEYRELAERCRKIKIPFAFGTFNLETIKEDKILDQRKQISHSWVRNAYNYILSQMTGMYISTGELYGAGGLNLKTKDGAIISANYPGYIRRYTIGEIIGASGDTNQGIIVGTSTEAESFDSYKLNGLITNGTATGQMSYTQGEIIGTYDPAAKKWTIINRRFINNNSGGDITVNEIGLIYTISWQISNGNCLVCRDLVSPGITVPNAGQLKAEYIFELTYPA